MIWASRHFQKANPQNLLRKCDLMRILVPWRAFGDLEACCELIPGHEREAMAEIEETRRRGIADIEEAYDPVLKPLPSLKQELEQLEAANFKAFREVPDPNHPYFGGLVHLMESIGKLKEEIPNLPKEGKAEARGRLKGMKAELREKTEKINDANKKRLKLLKRAAKDLTRLEEEREQRLAEVNSHADREIALIQETARDLMRICYDPEEARRYFAVAEKTDLEENEFNLNLPRYVDTFEPEEEIPLSVAIEELNMAEKAAQQSKRKIHSLLEGISWRGLSND